MTQTTSFQPALHPASVLDPASVESRYRALVAAGTHAMIAQRLAEDATANQLLRDQREQPNVEPKAEPEAAADLRG